MEESAKPSENGAASANGTTPTTVDEKVATH